MLAFKLAEADVELPISEAVDGAERGAVSAGRPRREKGAVVPDDLRHHRDRRGDDPRRASDRVRPDDPRGADDSGSVRKPERALCGQSPFTFQ